MLAVGTMKYINGTVYGGNWKNDNWLGRGTLTWSDRDSREVYEGEWKAYKRDGGGKYKCSDGNVYEGQWKRDKQHGIGTMKFINGK